MFEKRLTNILAASLLILMLILAVASTWNDTATFDESAHIVAGYSYLRYQDMRINPEHPPLIKDLAGLPLQFMNFGFPENDPSWTKNVNDQWNVGPKFLYESGNDPDKIVFWSRMGPILVMLLLGFYIFKWAREEFGDKTALMALTLYAFSPTILAHGRFVTTDVGAATGIFVSTYYLVKYLHDKSPKNFIILTVALGLALVTKFSTFLLIPFFGLLALIYGYIQNDQPFYDKIKNSIRYGLSTALIIACAFVFIVWPIYQFHTWNYPAEKQRADTAATLSNFGNRAIADPIIWMADKPILRPLAQYGYGLAMVIQRSAGGNTTYFMGEVSAAGWKSYFPIVYLIKEPLAKHILIVIALYGFVKLLIANAPRRSREPSTLVALKHWARNNFHEVAMLGFIALYWLTTLKSNLNIGIRHIIPTFPFVYLLISAEINKWATMKDNLMDFSSSARAGTDGFPLQSISGAIKSYFKIFTRYAVITILLLWYALSTVFIFPHFLAYFNEIAGGPKNGNEYVVDSNLDWGQDLKRLAQYVEKNKIDKIAVDYFGGGSPRYYLGDKFTPWWSAKGNPGGYFAVSATILKGSQGKTIGDIVFKPEDTYSWLKDKKPIATIGYSIFVYKLD